MSVHYTHDRVVFLGGAEKVLEDLMTHFGITDQTRLFVLYSTHRSFRVAGREIPIETALPTWINNLFARGGKTSWKIGRWLFDYRNLLFFYPLLCRLLRKKIKYSHPDRLVISSFAAVKNIVPPGGREIPTSVYIHSPMQYIWENADEYKEKLSGIKGLLFQRAVRFLRPRDSEKRLYTHVYANSKYTMQCVRSYYGLDAQVWYPSLDSLFLTTPATLEYRTYFVYVGRLVRFIREVDRIIDLCTRLDIPLLVVGSGPDEEILKSRAGSSIVFVGQVTDLEEKISIMRYARGLINLAKESCGIATMEALALGVPVLGYATGGTKELVGVTEDALVGPIISTHSGVLVTEKNPDTLDQALQTFLVTDWDRITIQQLFHTRYLAMTTQE